MRIVGKEIMGKLPAPKQVELPPLLSHPLHFYPTAFTRNAALSPLFPYFSFLSLSYEKVKCPEKIFQPALAVGYRECHSPYFVYQTKILFSFKSTIFNPLQNPLVLLSKTIVSERVGRGRGTLYALSISKPSWNDFLLVDTNGKKEWRRGFEAARI